MQIVIILSFYVFIQIKKKQQITNYIFLYKLFFEKNQKTSIRLQAILKKDTFTI